jgi:hypothetical protein
MVAIVLAPLAFAAEDEKKKLEPEKTEALAKALGVKGQVVNDKVFVISLPRTDLDVYTTQHGEVPTEAGLASTFRVWRCPCGKYYITGEFCVVDYESNDVIDSLRKSFWQIASVAPMLVGDRPRIVLVRFQGEGEMDVVIKTLKDALNWVGENRTKPNPIKD